MHCQAEARSDGPGRTSAGSSKMCMHLRLPMLACEILFASCACCMHTELTHTAAQAAAEQETAAHTLLAAKNVRTKGLQGALSMGSFRWPALAVHPCCAVLAQPHSWKTDTLTSPALDGGSCDLDDIEPGRLAWRLFQSVCHTCSRLNFGNVMSHHSIAAQHGINA